MFYLIFILNIFIASGNDGTYYLNKGLENKENYAEAEVNFKTAIELFRKENNYDDLAQTYYYLGYLNELNSKYEPSIIYFRKCLSVIDKQKKLNPELKYRCNERLATIYIYLNFYFKANKCLMLNNDLLKSTKLDSSIFNRHYYTQALYYFQIKEYGNTYHSLKQINLNYLKEIDIDYYNLLALTFNNIKDINNAITNYEIIYNKDPKNRTFLINFINFLYEYNNFNKAEELYNKFKILKSNEILIERLSIELLHTEVLYYRGEYHKSLLLLDSIRPFFEENKMYSRSANV